MNNLNIKRRKLLISAAVVASLPIQSAFGTAMGQGAHSLEAGPTSVTFTKTAPPDWLMAFWKEIDNKTWGSGFNCFSENAIAHLA